MANSKKRCKGCREYYQPSEGLQTPGGWFHAHQCAIDYARTKSRRDAEKKARKDVREGRERLKTRSDWLREAQQAFNRYIRARDAGKPCISCRRHHNGQYHAGHYRTVGSCPELRFEELQVYKQCAPCNSHLSGNIIEYRKNLVELLGEAMVQWIEGPHKPKKYTIDQLKELKRTYNQKARELESK